MGKEQSALSRCCSQRSKQQAVLLLLLLPGAACAAAAVVCPAYGHDLDDPCQKLLVLLLLLLAALGCLAYPHPLGDEMMLCRAVAAVELGFPVCANCCCLEGRSQHAQQVEHVAGCLPAGLATLHAYYNCTASSLSTVLTNVPHTSLHSWHLLPAQLSRAPSAV